MIILYDLLNSIRSQFYDFNSTIKKVISVLCASVHNGGTAFKTCAASVLLNNDIYTEMFSIDCFHQSSSVFQSSIVLQYIIILSFVIIIVIILVIMKNL